MPLKRSSIKLVTCIAHHLKACFMSFPDYSFLYILKCLFFPLLRPYNRYKLNFCHASCVFLGYSASHLGYKCLDLSSNRIYIAQHV